MKALISPNEQRPAGYRVAQVAAESFEVGQPLFWVDCADDVVADQFVYDPQDGQIKVAPPVEPDPVVLVAGTQPTVGGAETL